MSQALYTAISGISTAQDAISVVANNIANVNTTAYKSSNLNYETIYSRTLSEGTAPTDTNGGTNPTQIGLGVTVSSITTDWTNGSVKATGNASDLNISGNGFFSTQDSDGNLLLTRDGNFNVNADGYLVNSSGYNVLGTEDVSSSTGSQTPVHIPPSLSISVEGTDFTSGSSDLSNLNNADITNGSFKMTITDGSAAEHEITVNITSSTTGLDDVATAINSAITAYDVANSTTLASDVSAAVGNDGTFKVTASTGNTIAFEDGTSNFTSETGLNTASNDSGTYTSDVLNTEVSIGEPTGSNSKTITDYSIGIDGSITATYSNGDSLSVTTTANGENKELIYTTAGGIIIDASDITVNGNAVEAANLQIQLADVTNEAGLVSEGGNNYSLGANSGDLSFSIGDDNGMGSVNSGGLESSNVDLSSEFSDMILAQRAIDSDSRIFATVNQILQKIVQLGVR